MLEAHGIVARFPGGRLSLEGLDLSVAAGEWVAVTGANGSGKSTLCLVLAGLLEPESGAIQVDGELLTQGSASRARVGILFQEPEAQLLTSSIDAELSLPLENLGWPRAKIKERVARLRQEFDLASLSDRATRTLSGGEKSRLALAAALAAGPRYLVLDEPGVALDPGARDRLYRFLRREMENGLGVVLVTQLEEEWRGASRRLRLTQGKLEESVAGESIAPVAPSPNGDSPGPVLLFARGISHSYSAHPLLRDIDFELAAGELVLLEGENGSGKTTLLLILAGVLEPRSGQVRTAPGSTGNPARMGVLLQSPEDQLVCPSVLEDVALGLRRRGMGNVEATRLGREALARTGLDPAEIEVRPPSWLSHGERRRVAWAGLTALSARVWLLDEPSSGLDANGVLALRNAIARHLEGGGAVLMINQDPRLRHWGTRILSISNGRLARIETPEIEAPARSNDHKVHFSLDAKAL